MVHSTDPIHLPVSLPTQRGIDSSGGGWYFHNDLPHEWCWSADAFTTMELDAIIRMGEAINMDKGTTIGGATPAVRDSYVSWLFPNEITSWVYQRLEGVVKTINEQYFGFDLDGFFQGLQFTKYTAPGQHYTWHTDRGRGMGVRKLSLSVLLSDPDDYDGGDLELKFGEDAQQAERKRGIITLFPSWSLHRVTPVTRGTRYSLVAWVSGPPFK